MGIVRTLLKELPIAVVVVLGVSYLFKGQRELPLLWGEMLGPMAVCYPLTLEQRLALSQGETLPLLWTLLTQNCQFDPLLVRLPALASAILSLLLGGFSLRKERSAGERFLYTSLLLGTPAFLFYSHVIRPYEYLILGGTVVWLYRDQGSSSPIRIILAPLSLLGVPFVAPLYGAVLIREFFFPKTPSLKTIRPLLTLELSLALLVLSWEVGVLATLASPLLSTWMHERGFASLNPYRLEEAIYLTCYDRDLLGGVSLLLLVFFIGRSLFSSPRDLILLGFSGILTLLSILLFEPQLTARFFLGFYPALLDLFVRGLGLKVPQQGLEKKDLPLAKKRKQKRILFTIALFALVTNAVRSFALYWIHTPMMYKGVELRPPLSEILPEIREGDIILTDESWFLDQMILPVITRFAVELWIFRSGFTLPFSEPWLGGGPERWRDFIGLPWTKLTGVKIFRSPEDLLTSAQKTLEEKKRIVSLGFLSAPSHICHEPCPRLIKTKPPSLVVVKDRTISEEEREKICKEKAPLMVIGGTRIGYELFYPLVPIYSDMEFTQKVIRSLCPPP
jgi:hypothetical protein